MHFCRQRGKVTSRSLQSKFTGEVNTLLRRLVAIVDQSHNHTSVDRPDRPIALLAALAIGERVTVPCETRVEFVYSARRRQMPAPRQRIATELFVPASHDRRESS